MEEYRRDRLLDALRTKGFKGSKLVQAITMLVDVKNNDLDKIIADLADVAVLERHLDVFYLAYDCESFEKIPNILPKLGKKVIEQESVQDYLGRAASKIHKALNDCEELKNWTLK